MQLPGTRKSDIPVVFLLLVAILSLALFLQHEFSIKQSLLFLIGIGLGATLLHAAFGFAGGWRQFVRDRHGAAVRAQIILIGLTSLVFFPLIGKAFPDIQVAPALSQAGVSVLIGAFLFGLGMQLGGGCGSGTLFTVGGGHVRMMIVLAFFIVGATIGGVHLPGWKALPNLGEVSLIQQFGWLPALLMQGLVLFLLLLFVQKLEKNRHGNIEQLGKSDERSFSERIVFGPWSLWWAIVLLTLLNLATMLLAGHPWSITFAFGLWGTKIWAALGGDISQWVIWQGGYAAKALNSSVLADTTSLMDFGIILGAMLAAALAGTFSPASKLGRTGVLTAIAGGLLMGYGARLAFGCNIGGLLAGMASGSLHGWLWLLSGFVGTIVGVKLRIMLKMDKQTRVEPHEA